MKLLFTILFLAVGAAVYSQNPYIRPTGFDSERFSFLENGEADNPVSCKDSETNYFKIRIRYEEQLTQEEEIVETFFPEGNQWTEADEKRFEGSYNASNLENLNKLLADNSDISDAFFQSFRQDLYEYFKASWTDAQCGTDCIKPGYECNSSYKIHYIDTSIVHVRYLTSLAYIEEEGPPLKVTQTFSPHLLAEYWVYFEFSCKCEVAEDAISHLPEDFWDPYTFIGHNTKYTPVAYAPKIDRRYGWWPWAAGITGGGIITYFLLRKTDEPTTPLIDAVDDQLTLSCLETGTIDVLANDLGEGLTIGNITTPPGIDVVNTGNGILQLPAGLTGSFSFSYTLIDNAQQSDQATVTVTVELPPITATPDNYQVQSGQPLSGNVLTNDVGSGLQLTAFTQPAGGGLDLLADGSFTLLTEECQDLSFNYTVTDVCQQTAETNVTVEVSPIGLSPVPDTYTGEAGLPLTGNVLENDAGTGLEILDFTQSATGTLTLQTDGSFNFEPADCDDAQFEYTVGDACGQSQTVSVSLSFTDQTPPELSCPPDITLECVTDPDPSITGTATAEDFCTDNPTIAYTDEWSGTPCDQLVERQWTATDEAGNAHSCVQLIQILDVENPVLIDCPTMDLTVPCDSIPDPPEVTASDNCTPEPEIQITETQQPGQNPNESYRLLREWTAIDSCGNASSCSYTLIVVDTEAPEVSCPVDLTISCETDPDPANTGSPLVTDNCSTDLDIEYSDDDSGLTGCNETGTLIRSWEIADEAENTATCQQTITVEDNTPPEWVECPPDIGVFCGQQNDLTLTGIGLADDNCSGTLQGTYIDDLSGLIGCSGTIVRVWTAIDSCGMPTPPCNQTITVAPTSCSFEPFYDITPANCGDDNGIIAIGIDPPGNYTFLWEDGFTGSTHFDLAAGNYSVTISDPDDFCTEIFVVTMTELPGNFVDTIFTDPASCLESGEIILILNNNPQNYNITVTGPVNFNVNNVPPGGSLALSNFSNIPPGNYTIAVEGSPLCTEFFEVVVLELPSFEMNVVEIIQPSCPSCFDGEVTFFAGSGAIPPIDVYVNGNYIGTVSDAFFTVNGLPPGTFTFHIEDANGCLSFPITLTLMAQEAQDKDFAMPFIPLLPASLFSPISDPVAEGLSSVVPEHPPIDPKGLSIVPNQSIGGFGFYAPGGLLDEWGYQLNGNSGTLFAQLNNGIQLETPFRSWQHQVHQRKYFGNQDEEKAVPYLEMALFWERFSTSHTRINSPSQNRWVDNPIQTDYWGAIIRAGFKTRLPGGTTLELNGQLRLADFNQVPVPGMQLRLLDFN